MLSPGLRHRLAAALRTDGVRALRRDGVRALRRVAPPAERSRAFRRKDHDRFWWHKLHATDYEPPIYALLDEREWKVMADWYAETERIGAIGEINVPAMSLTQGIVMGNGLRRIVQLGHFYGYSALLIGFWLRRMGGERTLVSIDIDPAATAFTQRWIDRAGLGDHVKLLVGDSASEEAVAFAREAFGGRDLELLLIDSSHAYAHTLRELDLWVPHVPVDALVLMHDTSIFAQEFDPTGEGGVRRALEEWLPAHPEVAALSLNGHELRAADGNDIVYKDGCGLGILQRVC
jgi:predicted O-methyltransferase YrrM